MKRLLNYKGLLIIWISLSIILYGYEKTFPIQPLNIELKKYWSPPEAFGGAPYLNYEYDKDGMIYEIKKDFFIFLPYLSISGIVLIGGFGYLLRKN